MNFLRSTTNNFVRKYVRSRKMSLIDPKNKTKQKGNQLPVCIQNSWPKVAAFFPLGQNWYCVTRAYVGYRLLKFRFLNLAIWFKVYILRRKYFALLINVDLFVTINLRWILSDPLRKSRINRYPNRLPWYFGAFHFEGTDVLVMHLMFSNQTIFSCEINTPNCLNE